ncbi:hypothetical protein E2C01_053131 [Portunus trituberculatus]|uniref:Uncharacterized protein n=1 Tax=Portunus trituberculatus TaxID=210409 RepID=A0A5B7GNL7_PORTR|nr:hypothetical protein [Portunus trituberculatus]
MDGSQPPLAFLAGVETLEMQAESNLKLSNSACKNKTRGNSKSVVIELSTISRTQTPEQLPEGARFGMLPPLRFGHEMNPPRGFIYAGDLSMEERGGEPARPRPLRHIKGPVCELPTCRDGLVATLLSGRTK